MLKIAMNEWVLASEAKVLSHTYFDMRIWMNEWCASITLAIFAISNLIDVAPYYLAMKRRVYRYSVRVAFEQKAVSRATIIHKYNNIDWGKSLRKIALYIIIYTITSMDWIRCMTSKTKIEVGVSFHSIIIICYYCYSMTFFLVFFMNILWFILTWNCGNGILFALD